MELAFAFLGIPKVVWIVLLAIGLIYGQIQGARAMMEAFSRRYRYKKLADWPATLKNSRTIKMQVEDGNAILLERTAVGSYIIKHVFANSIAMTVTYKTDVITGTQAQAEAVFDRWVAEGLSDEGRVDGFRQLGTTYVEPKNKRNKKR